jgi:hypothetical protein
MTAALLLLHSPTWRNVAASTARIQVRPTNDSTCRGARENEGGLFVLLSEPRRRLGSAVHSLTAHEHDISFVTTDASQPEAGALFRSCRCSAGACWAAAGVGSALVQGLSCTARVARSRNLANCIGRGPCETAVASVLLSCSYIHPEVPSCMSRRHVWKLPWYSSTMLPGTVCWWPSPRRHKVLLGPSTYHGT